MSRCEMSNIQRQTHKKILTPYPSDPVASGSHVTLSVLARQRLWQHGCHILLTNPPCWHLSVGEGLGGKNITNLSPVAFFLYTEEGGGHKKGRSRHLCIICFTVTAVQKHLTILHLLLLQILTHYASIRFSYYFPDSDKSWRKQEIWS